MKIIQSFWGGKNKKLENHYGWFDYKFHWLGWMLSCHQLIKFYDHVELYTDDFGKDILINKLQLPYTKVHVVLDELNDLPNDLWAMAKIKTYSLQEKPFLHVDGDVFIFAPFPVDLLNSPLIVQNQEFTTKYYRDMWAKIHPHLKYMPKQMKNFHEESSNLAFNMGIIGGNDLDFFQSYCQCSMDFVNKNKTVWNEISLQNFNVFYEQVLLAEFSKEQNKKVDVYIQEDIGDNEYTGFGDFEDVPIKRTYLHLIGEFKKDSCTCHKLLQYCWYYNPEWIKTLFNLFLPNWIKELDFKFDKIERENLLKWYKENFAEQKISQKRLVARDLFSFEQNILFNAYEKSDDNYTITLLPEIFFSRISDSGYNLSVRDFFNDSFIRNLDEIDEVIFFELNSPKRKYELFNSLLSHFEVDLQVEDKEKLRLMLDERIKYYIGHKIISTNI